MLTLLATTVAISDGCRHVNNSNPIVVKAATLANAEKTVNTIAHGLLAADQTIDALQATEPDYYAAVQPKLKTLARLNEVANQCIVTALNGGTCNWQAAVVAIATEAGKPDNLTTFGFKNPNSQKIAQTGFIALIAGINMAIQFQQQTGGQ